MYIFAYICLLVALLCSLGAGGMALLQLHETRAAHLEVLRKIQWLVTACLLLASSLLLHALFWKDYRLEYVASYTDSLLPTFYRLTAFWAGQPGSLLFWALAVSISGSIFTLVKRHRQLSHRTRLWFWALFHANMAFFCLTLTCWSNPFIMLQPAPLDGNGLNPLLQNPGMIFHPPLLFMGYAGFTVPACLALAQQLDGSPGEPEWDDMGRPYLLVSWILLTAGIILGAWWAYMELGWGGYWGWDPVENASLLPWLAATATIHALAIKHRSGKLGRTCATLMALAVITAFFATYLTRSGIIQSVHAFGDGGVGLPLLAFVFFSLIITFTVTLSAPERGEALAGLASREGALMLAVWLFLALALIILTATIWPVFSGISGGLSQGLDASFYNRVCLPLAAILLALLAICGWLGPRDGFASRPAFIKFLATCGAFAASLGAIWVAGFRQPLALLAASAAIAALCAASMRCLDKNLLKSSRFRAALGAHLGLAILAIGIAFSGPYTVDREVFLSKGQQTTVGPYTVTLENIKDGEEPAYAYLRADLKVSLDGVEKGVISPERRIYAKFGSMQFSEVDVLSTLGEDVYASLLGMDEDYRVMLKISIEPLVNWIWIGGTLMCILPLLGLGRSRGRA